MGIIDPLFFTQAYCSGQLKLAPRNAAVDKVHLTNSRDGLRLVPRILIINPVELLELLNTRSHVTDAENLHIAETKQASYARGFQGKDFAFPPAVSQSA
jgi:hypothetical protein